MNSSSNKNVTSTDDINGKRFCLKNAFVRSRHLDLKHRSFKPFNQGCISLRRSSAPEHILQNNQQKNGNNLSFSFLLKMSAVNKACWLMRQIRWSKVSDFKLSVNLWVMDLCVICQQKCKCLREKRKSTENTKRLNLRLSKNNIPVP